MEFNPHNNCYEIRCGNSDVKLQVSMNRVETANHTKFLLFVILGLA